MLTAHTSTTRSNTACVELRDGDQVIAKMYASPDEQRIRIVLPELKNYGQVLISPDNRLLEFDRQVKK